MTIFWLCSLSGLFSSASIPGLSPRPRNLLEELDALNYLGHLWDCGNCGWCCWQQLVHLYSKDPQNQGSWSGLCVSSSKFSLPCLTLFLEISFGENIQYKLFVIHQNMSSDVIFDVISVCISSSRHFDGKNTSNIFWTQDHQWGTFVKKVIFPPWKVENT